ncbi:hypothetical protein MUK42_35368, partial [Musa troglodytarum]
WCHRQLPPGVQGGSQGGRPLHLEQFLGRLFLQTAPGERHVGRHRLRQRGRKQRPLRRPCSLLEGRQHVGAESSPKRKSTVPHAPLFPSSFDQHRPLQLSVGAVIQQLLPVLL